MRGALRNVTNVWWDAVDARLATDERKLIADGEVVWSWRPDAGAKVRGAFARVTVAKKPGHRGEYEISRKPLRRESRDASAEPVCSCAFSLCTLHTRPRVQRAPGFPCALFSCEGEGDSKARTHRAARSEGMLIRHCEKRSDEAIQFLRSRHRGGLLRGAVMGGCYAPTRPVSQGRRPVPGERRTTSLQRFLIQHLEHQLHRHQHRIVAAHQVAFGDAAEIVDQRDVKLGLQRAVGARGDRAGRAPRVRSRTAPRRGRR